MRHAQRREARFRATIYAATVAVLGLVAVLVARSGWRSTASLHGLLEALGTTLALTIGALALVRYYSRKERLFLYLGAAFIATGVLDGYHAGVALPWTGGVAAADRESLAAWSWIASRTVLGLLLLRLAFVPRFDRGGFEPGLRAEAIVYATVAVFAGTALSLLAVAPLLAPVRSGLIARPQELLPGALFLASFGLHVRQRNWRVNAFEHWLVLGLLLAAATHAFIACSRTPGDGWFDAGHGLKIASYACVLVGLFASVYFTYRRLEESGAKLAATNEALRRAMNAAEAANRAKSEFLASMSHELRTPLNSVIGFTKVLLRSRGGDLRPKDRTYLERIAANGEHLLGLINDLLDLSRIEAGRIDLEPVPTALAELIRETAAQLEGRRDPNVELVVRVPPAAAPILTDPQRLRQVLINLIGNALKFTHAGMVTVELETDEDGAPSAIRVIDTGIGVEPERLDRIFEPFEQADRSTSRRYGGTGLGLSISRGLCERLGYRLEASSRPGEGSTFTIVLGDGAGIAAGG